MNIEPVYSSLDYPKKMALVLFTQGCDLRCKYCHNPQLLKLEKPTPLEVEMTLNEIDENVDFIDGIVLSGGEPLLQVETIKKFIDKAKSLNLKIKLDTNGLHPDKIIKIIDNIDYVAMDIKAPLDKYYKITDRYPQEIQKTITKTIEIIQNHGVYLECRTTYVPQLLSPEDIKTIISQINCDCYTLQQFRNRSTLDVELLTAEEPNPEDMRKILENLETKIPEIRLKSRQFGNQIIK